MPALEPFGRRLRSANRLSPFVFPENLEKRLFCFVAAPNAVLWLFSLRLNLPPPVAKLELHSGTRKPADKVSQVTSTPVSFLGQRLSIDENTGKPVHHNPYTGSANGHYQGRQDLNWNHHHENSKRCPAEAKRPPTSFLVTHFNSPGSVLCTLGIRHHSNFALVLTLQAPESPLTGRAINSTPRLLFRQGNSELTPPANLIEWAFLEGQIDGSRADLACSWLLVKREILTV